MNSRNTHLYTSPRNVYGFSVLCACACVCVFAGVVLSVESRLVSPGDLPASTFTVSIGTAIGVLVLAYNLRSESGQEGERTSQPAGQRRTGKLGREPKHAGCGLP